MNMFLSTPNATITIKTHLTFRLCEILIILGRRAGHWHMHGFFAAPLLFCSLFSTFSLYFTIFSLFLPPLLHFPLPALTICFSFSCEMSLLSDLSFFFQSLLACASLSWLLHACLASLSYSHTQLSRSLYSATLIYFSALPLSRCCHTILSHSFSSLSLSLFYFSL